MKTIFVSIASYRDKLCSSTIKSLIDNSEHADRVTIGVCEQNEEKDVPCFDKKYEKHVKMIKMKSNEAEGPGYARFLCSQLYNNEDYFFQIDSHSKLVKHWDTKIIRMIEACGSKKPILSHYPPGFEDYEEEPKSDSLVTFITTAFVNDQGMISFEGASLIKPPKHPKKNYFIAAGFIFAPGTFVTEVPFDPYLQNLFVGEEILLSIRAYTHGWDVFSPNQNILYHFYTRKGEPKFWDKDYKNPTDAELKTKIIIGREDVTKISMIKDENVRNSINKYNIGTKRTLAQFYKSIKLKEKSKKIKLSNCNLMKISFLLLLGLLLILIIIYIITKMKKNKFK